MLWRWMIRRSAGRSIQSCAMGLRAERMCRLCHLRQRKPAAIVACRRSGSASQRCHRRRRSTSATTGTKIMVKMYAGSSAASWDCRARRHRKDAPHRCKLYKPVGPVSTSQPSVRRAAAARRSIVVDAAARLQPASACDGGSWPRSPAPRPTNGQMPLQPLRRHGTDVGGPASASVASACCRVIAYGVMYR